LQAKLLRVLQEQRFERVGGNGTIQTDVRIIAATHCDLEHLTRSGAFRPDLYWRLNGFPIHLPPLRERGADVHLLLEHFLETCSRGWGGPLRGRGRGALGIRPGHPWRENVRELQSAVRPALAPSTGPVILVEALPEQIREGRPAVTTNGSAIEESFERWMD